MYFVAHILESIFMLTLGKIKLSFSSFKSLLRLSWRWFVNEWTVRMQPSCLWNISWFFWTNDTLFSITIFSKIILMPSTVKFLVIISNPSMESIRLFWPKFEPLIFFVVLPLLDVRDCCKLPSYTISRKMSNFKKMATNFVLGLILTRWAQIYPNYFCEFYLCFTSTSS